MKVDTGLRVAASVAFFQVERRAHTLGLVELQQTLLVLLDPVQLIQVVKDAGLVPLASEKVQITYHSLLAFLDLVLSLLYFVHQSTLHAASLDIVVLILGRLLCKVHLLGHLDGI